MGKAAAMLKRFVSKFLPDIAHYSKKSFAADIGAGITVGIVALPLSLALAVATGVPPILGLYTAGLAGFLAALFAGSPYSVSGPAAAMVPILAAIIHQHGIAQMPYIALIAALFLLFFAVLGIGKFIRKVPESVILGFTAGVAVVIFCSQLNTFLGLTGITAHESFAAKLLETLTHLGTVSLPALIIGAATVAIILFWNKIPVVGKIPPTLIAVLVATLSVLFVPFFGSLATLGSQFGQLPLGLPPIPQLDVSRVLAGDLWWPALQVAALIAVESLLCAVVADKLTGTRHRPNQELFAQGVGNLGTALIGAMPATAVIARTGTIIKSGAKSRIASLTHAVIVMVFVLALAPLAANIPLTALSAVLLVTAIRIGEFKGVAAFVQEKSWRLNAVLGTTLLLTIFTDLVVGVGAGLLLHLAFATHNRLRGKRDQDGPIALAEEEA